MGLFGIEIGGEGPGDYAADGIGEQAEQAVKQLLEQLEALGFTITFSAVMAPHAAGGAAPPEEVRRVPVEEGAFKCPACGLSYASTGECVGGEYGHPPVTVLPTAEVLNAPATADMSLAGETDVSGDVAGDASLAAVADDGEEKAAPPAWPTP